jgi:2-keto-4-pentenoate hydratase/2-oxohepta-3-ene-1,7-dioic acid hydratase in catechol pathway
MKIIRYLAVDGRILHGIQAPGSPASAQVIRGNIFEEFEVSEEITEVARILFPVTPPNILAVGMNYMRHADEINIENPSVPVLFLKGTNSLIGSGEPIILPEAGIHEVDFEAELAVIIGKKAKTVSPREAMDYVFGYTCCNDVSARDWQFHKQKGQWARGKSFDSFCPLGPCLVTKDDILRPNRLHIRAILNGEIMQDSNTSDMIFDVPALVSDLSRSMTLYPGTIILTGTPEGVGFVRKPPIFLKEGDVITVTIEEIGELTNPVIREK